MEDSLAATRAAMEDGIVPGGGIALFNVYRSTEHAKSNELSVARAAHLIIMKALSAPLTAIISNSGESPAKTIKELTDQKSKSKNSKWLGFNAITGEIVDLKTVGIIDPLKVTKSAFINAVSVAGNFLTVGAAITELPKKEEPAPPMPHGDY